MEMHSVVKYLFCTFDCEFDGFYILVRKRYCHHRRIIGIFRFYNYSFRILDLL